MLGGGGTLERQQCMEPLDDRASLIEEMKREQSDWEDWRPTDCDFWQPFDLETDDEGLGD